LQNRFFQNNLFKQVIFAFVFILSIISIVLAGYLVIKNTNQQNAQASGVLDIVLTQKVTGTAPFDSTSGPGNDTSATDTVIRTNDTLTYEWQFSVNTITDGAANNVRISQTLPADMKWNQLPPQCLTTGVTPVSSISANGLTIVCNV